MNYKIMNYNHEFKCELLIKSSQSTVIAISVKIPPIFPLPMDRSMG